MGSAYGSFDTQVMTGVELRYSEYWVRSCFQEYAQQEYAQRQIAKGIPRRAPNAPPNADIVAVGLEHLRSSTKVVHTLHAQSTCAHNAHIIAKDP